ncbi:glycoside hydrolase superfamily [Aspergillus karnatakaensis]|uniref:glycoside hydrolase superfamily n=1 Tax=Aspergillus karnatakaensis TaxID=1810916 RepID=UPI003CCC9BDB
MRPSWPVLAAALWAIPAAASANQPLCPAPCSADPSKWTPYTSMEMLKDCDHPVLLDFSSHESLDAPKASFRILACTIEDETFEPTEPSSLFLDPSQTDIDLKGWETQDGYGSSFDQISFLLDHVQTVVDQVSHGEKRSVLGRLNTTAVGIYTGAQVDSGLVASAIDDLRTLGYYFRTRRSAAIQLCDDDNDKDRMFGIAVDTTGVMDSVQWAVDSWANAQCVEIGETALDIRNIPVADDALDKRSQLMFLHGVKKFTCTTEPVLEGDKCPTLAARCNITEGQLMEYNSNNNLCSRLEPGQDVCCTEKVPVAGRPSMNEDGSCAVYTTGPEDTCLTIAERHNLKESDINYYNNWRIWGWSGCDLIHAGLRICLSDGHPPLPAPQLGATCGPTVPGTEMPKDGTPLAELNPCLLNACCNNLGNCGVSPEFCVIQEGPTGNPGTAPPGTTGCISKCGLDILGQSDPPADFLRIGYYESFNFDRPCLNLRAAHIRPGEYSHVHWGFASIDETFHVFINDTYGQWDDFLALEGMRRVISFGGWAGTAGSTVHDVLRQAVKPANVDTFIVNIMAFVQEHNLDGVDFDWEYPGASEVPSVQFDLFADGPNYLAFLQKLRMIFPADKSVSIAAPASYWHLKAFPIEQMWPHLDYIIYMTYDLHGQWDFNDFYAQDWCEAGNCLRSHVNLTETEYALAMITKAGVPRNAIAVGVASYGRSFGMTEPGCATPDCTFDGPQTTAMPGVCTQTAGVLANAEIEEIIIEGEFDEWYYDAASDSNVLVYNETQWVAFLGKGTMRRRVDYYKSLGFAGFANWAIDLTRWTGDDGDPAGTGDSDTGKHGSSSPCMMKRP